VSLHCVFAAKGAHISSVLCDFHFLDLLSEGGAVSIKIVSDMHFRVKLSLDRIRGGKRAVLLVCSPGAIFPSHANLCSDESVDMHWIHGLARASPTLCALRHV
jgi:hypothetical protein